MALPSLRGNCPRPNKPTIKSRFAKQAHIHIHRLSRKEKRSFHSCITLKPSHIVEIEQVAIRLVLVPRRHHHCRLTVCFAMHTDGPGHTSAELAKGMHTGKGAVCSWVTAGICEQYRLSNSATGHRAFHIKEYLNIQVQLVVVGMTLQLQDWTARPCDSRPQGYYTCTLYNNLVRKMMPSEFKDSAACQANLVPLPTVHTPNAG